MSKDEILWVGVQGEMEETIVPRAGLTLKLITGGAIVGVPFTTTLKNGLKLAWSVVLSGRIMKQFRPDVVFLTGGYMSVPVALAAWLRRIPSLVYLPDLEPGAAIKFIGRFVQTIAATFQESAQYFPAGKTVIETGYPVRAELRQAAALDKTEALRQFNLTPERKTLFVFGGSRGARSINEALMQHLPNYLETMQVIHISGTLTWSDVEAHAQQLPDHLKAYYRPYPYLHEEMGAAFRAADLIVARAGASMLGEGPMFGTPAILVPYPHAWRYQKVNADHLAERGAAVRLDDEQLGTELWPAVSDLMQDDEKRNRMAQAAQALRSPNAAQQLAKQIMNMGRGTAHA